MEYPDSFVEKLLEKGAGVNSIYTIPRYPYSWNGKRYEPNPKANKKVSALYLAVEQNRTKMVEILLKNGADINWKYEDGKTVRELSCSEEIRKLLK